MLVKLHWLCLQCLHYRTTHPAPQSSSCITGDHHPGDWNRWYTDVEHDPPAARYALPPDGHRTVLRLAEVELRAVYRWHTAECMCHERKECHRLFFTLHCALRPVLPHRISAQTDMGARQRLFGRLGLTQPNSSASGREN